MSQSVGHKLEAWGHTLLLDRGGDGQLSYYHHCSRNVLMEGCSYAVFCIPTTNPSHIIDKHTTIYPRILFPSTVTTKLSIWLLCNLQTLLPLHNMNSTICTSKSPR